MLPRRNRPAPRPIRMRRAVRCRCGGVFRSSSAVVRCESAGRVTVGLPSAHSVGVVFGGEDHVEAGDDDGRGENEAEEYQD